MRIKFQSCPSITERMDGVSSAEYSPNPAIVDVDVVEQIFEGNAAHLRDVFEVLADALPAYVTQLEMSAAAGDWPAVARVAHRVAGAVSNVGAVRVASLARSIENAALSGEPALDSRTALGLAAIELLQVLDAWTRRLMANDHLSC